MPQIQLPFFPHGATEINVNLAILREGDTVTYPRFHEDKYLWSFAHFYSRCERKVGILNRCRAKFCAIALTGEIEPKKVEEYQQKKGELQEEISYLEKDVEQLKQERKATKKHITIADPHFHGDKITGGGAFLPPEHKE